MSAYGSYLLETFITLVAVCAVAFVVLYGAKRLGVGQASGDIRLVGRLPLDARRAVYLVRVGAQVFVVGVAEGGMTKLGEIPAASLGAAIPASAPFADVFARVLAGARGRGSAAAAGEGVDAGSLDAADAKAASGASGAAETDSPEPGAGARVRARARGEDA